MKSLIIILCFIIPIFSNAQNVSGNDKRGLNEAELEQAKTLYVEMMKTDLYIRWKACINQFSEKAPVNVPMGLPSKAGDKTTRDEAKRHVSEWLTKYLSETKFKTLDEGVALYMESLDMGIKNMENNLELYKLIASATADQIGEIVKPEMIAERQKILGY